MAAKPLKELTNKNIVRCSKEKMEQSQILKRQTSCFPIQREDYGVAVISYA